jgi:hypothetical protein
MISRHQTKRSSIIRLITHIRFAFSEVGAGRLTLSGIGALAEVSRTHAITFSMCASSAASSSFAVALAAEPRTKETPMNTSAAAITPHPTTYPTVVSHPRRSGSCGGRGAAGLYRGTTGAIVAPQFAQVCPAGTAAPHSGQEVRAILGEGAIREENPNEADER